MIRVPLLHCRCSFCASYRSERAAREALNARIDTFVAQRAAARAAAMEVEP